MAGMCSKICGAKVVDSKEAFYRGKPIPADARVALPSKDRVQVRYSVGQPANGVTLLADQVAQVFNGEAALNATLELGVRVSWILDDEKDRAAQAQFLIRANKGPMEECAELAEKLASGISAPKAQAKVHTDVSIPGSTGADKTVKAKTEAVKS